ncbi:MAG: rod shape-determining protein RodA [Syntrophobacterales bacterium]|nr:rod shape-determining protein RodA [Syntrophobacterales bacterium]
MIDRRLIIHFHWPLLATVLLLITCGLINLYSSTYVIYGSSTSWCSPFFARQLVWTVIGLLGMIGATLFDYRRLQTAAPVIYMIGIFLLFLVLVIGEESHGAVRWLKFGPIQIQPSEFEKVILVIAIAAWGASDRIKTYPSIGQIGIFLLINLPPFILIFLEPDLGTALILIITSCTTLFCLGIQRRIIVAFTILGLMAGYPLWHYGLKEYQKDRIRTAIDPDRDPKKRGYHIRQAKIAIGSGMVWGKGYLQGTQSKLRFLPERHTDFAFAVWAEEWGFVGAVAVLCLFCLLVYFCFQSAFTAKDRFGSLLVIGLSANITWEIVINTGMVLGFLPVVGVPLPFISYGGSALLRCLVSIGLIQNVCMRRFGFKK